MGSKEFRRVVFYSKEDMSSGYNLKKTEDLLKQLNFTEGFDVNDLLELYNMKLYFDNDMFLTTWGDLTKADFKEKIHNAESVIRNYFLSINDNNVLENVESLETVYKETFWELINKFQVFKKISKPTFTAILDKFPFQITIILAFKQIVNHFDKEIRSFLMGYERTAELLLTQYEEKHRSNPPNYHFPGCLNLADKEGIISRYLEREHANLNYVRLVEHSNTSELRLSTKVKLKARKRAEELNSKVLEEGYSWNVGAQVSLDKDQDEPVTFSHKEHIVEVSYSERYLDQQKDEIALFHLFPNLFGYTDGHGLITLVSKESELDVMEKVFMKSKNEYAGGMAFQRKSYLSHVQMLLFNHYLSQRGRSIEELIDTFITRFLNEYFNINNLQFKFPSPHSTFLEKIRVLAPEFEFLLKQFQVYVNEGHIDFELLEFSSTPLRLSEIKSLVAKKYLYSDSPIAQQLKYYFFSDQSLLYYVEPYKEKYDNLYTLLTNELVPFDNFEDYQKDTLHHLIEKDYLHLDVNRIVRIKKGILLHLVGELHKNEVLSYWHYPDFVRREIDEMLDANLLIADSTLFTKQEVNFFNYYLNKKEFTNGLDLRNKYLHGTNSSAEKEHEFEYYILLKVIILTLLKIEDDLLISKQSM